MRDLPPVAAREVGRRPRPFHGRQAEFRTHVRWKHIALGRLSYRLQRGLHRPTSFRAPGVIHGISANCRALFRSFTSSAFRLQLASRSSAYTMKFVLLVNF